MTRLKTIPTTTGPRAPHDPTREHDPQWRAFQASGGPTHERLPGLGNIALCRTDAGREPLTDDGRAVTCAACRQVWTDYNAAADWTARRKLRDVRAYETAAERAKHKPVPGAADLDLPIQMSHALDMLIDEDPEAFEAHVRATCYALAMSGFPPCE